MKVKNGIDDMKDLGRQRGFTLVEALVVMIVGIVILAAAAAGMGKLFRTSEVSTEISNITQITANLRNIRTSHGFKGIDNKLLVKLKAIPADMSQTADGVITNSWGGDVKITPRYDSGFMIEYNKVPAEACMQLALKLRGSGGGWSWFNFGSTSKRADVALSTKEISDLCKNSGGHIWLEGS